MTEEHRPPEPTTPVEEAPPAFTPHAAVPHRRPLYRSRTERMVSGLSGGIAEYLGIDPVLVRVGWIVFALLTAGAALIAYAIGWAIVPEDPLPLVGVPDASGVVVERHRGHRHGSGGIVVGIVLVVAGLLWLLATTGVLDRLQVHVDLGAALAGGLITVGLLLVLSGGRLARGALIPLGILLSVGLLTVASGSVTEVQSGFSERIERPTGTAQLRDNYSHAFGSMTLDLRGVDFPTGTTTIRTSTAFGSLLVRTPASVAVRVRANVALGSIEAVGGEASGIVSKRVFETPGFDTTPRRLEIEVSTAFGSVEVQR